MQITVDSRTLDKVMSIGEKNKKYLQQILASQTELKQQLDAQQLQLDQIMQLLNATTFASISTSTSTKGKGKDKRKHEEFYEVSICMPSTHLLMITNLYFRVL
jgi:hypothetical protein